jgi:GMP synthase (glutamine-hydrolysing)
MGLGLKRIKSFDDWSKRKLLVIHMETRNLDVEACLRTSSIPFYAIMYNMDGLDKKVKELTKEIAGIIITGSIKNGEKYPDLPDTVIKLNVPILGLCYGNEWLARKLGGKIIECNAPVGEYSEVEAVLDNSILFKGIEGTGKTIVTMAHKYMMNDLPNGCRKIASTKLTPIAGFENLKRKVFGLQFHPEKGFLGSIVFKNFFDFCNPGE